MEEVTATLKSRFEKHLRIAQSEMFEMKKELGKSSMRCSCLTWRFPGIPPCES